MTKIVVENLSPQTTVDSLSRLFAPFGTVQSISLATDIMTGRCSGFGFVQLTERTAGTAQHALHGSQLSGRTLRVRVEEKAAPYLYKNC